MRTIHFAALCVILFASGVISVLGEDEGNTTTTEIITTTTTVVTTPTTEIPTTTEVHTTTTEAPTTTAEPTTKPVVTTTEVPVTTKAPIPETHKGHWNVSNAEGNVTCIRAELQVLFTIPINGQPQYIALDPNSASDGDCDLTNTTQTLGLHGSNYDLQFIFEKDSGKVSVSNVSLSYRFSEESGEVYSHSKLFSVSLGNAYVCNSENDVKLDNVTMEIKYIHIEAFREDSKNGFSHGEDCQADDKVKDAVPIAVGCALVALIVIVLIAYLVGRRRSRQRGYQSV